MTRKEHLIKSLETAIDALINDTVYYNWKDQCSCNAGIVSQAVLNIDKDELESRKGELFDKIANINKNLEEHKRLQNTWKAAIQHTCSLTGKTSPQIIKDLEEAGLSKNDMVHLEYLDNSGILANSDISTITTVEKKLMGYETKIILDKSTFLKRLRKDTKEVDVPIYVNIVKEVYPENYYMEKENLIKYLVSWTRILKNESKQGLKSIEILESQLLVAVAEENYEKAVELRNQIYELS